MDYELMTRQLRQAADAWEKRHPVTPTFELVVQDALRSAADALTDLLAENVKLRDEAEGMRSNWYKAVEAVKNLRAEQEKAKTEITRLKHYEDKCHDCPIVCAKTEIIKAHEELEAVQNELEQVKREKDALIGDFVDYVTDGVPIPAIFCRNRCDKCTDMRGWCTGKNCSGFYPSGARGQKED